MNVSDYWREQSRKRRIKARESGRCIICMTREARTGRVTCERCCAAATAATKRRRSMRRPPAQAPITVMTTPMTAMTTPTTAAERVPA